MNLREEIEKLPGYIMYDEKGDEAAQWIRRDKVLPILDKWELVADNEAGKLIPVRLGDLLEKNIRPGDRIAVYVRRKR